MVSGNIIVGFINFKMLDYIRYDSSSNLLEALKSEQNKETPFPSIEADLYLKNKIELCFEYLKPLLRSNRSDVVIDPTKSIIPISFIRDEIDKRITNIKDDYEVDTVTRQEIFGNLITDIYTKYEGDKEAFCNENAYLFFNKLCNEGIDKELIRVVRFYNYSNYNNHVLILYSSSRSLFDNIEKYCNFDLSNINQEATQSYSTLINLLIDTQKKDKDSQLMIIDPWSRDNKIIDLRYRDNNVYQILKEQNQFVDEDSIEARCINIIINGMLRESMISKDFNYQGCDPFSDLNNSDCVVSMDYPLGKPTPPVPPKKTYMGS
ncbi:hypothetical protein [Arsenophonus sp.]|uniref:hypothetical protein n=1 Tax=Arsenophonus sp. TaxID=1872640 RepID=UPI0038796295